MRLFCVQRNRRRTIIARPSPREDLAIILSQRLVLFMDTSAFTLTIDDITVDTLPLFIQLAADTASAYKEVDLLYETDKIRFHNAAARSPYAKHTLFTTGGIDRQIYAAKYSGLLLAAIEDGQNSPLFKKVIAIMTKRWHGLYCHIRDCETLDLAGVIKPHYYSKPVKDSYKHNLLTGAATRYIRSFITLYPSIDLPLQATLKFSLFIACVAGRPVTVSDPELLSIIQTISSNLDNTQEINLLKSRLNKSAVKKMARYLKNVIYQKIYHNYLDPWQDDRLLEGLAHCNAYLSSEEGISLLSPTLIAQIKERDVELLCRLYIVKMAAETFRAGQVKKSKEEMELDCAEFVMFGLNLLDFVREYKKAKKYYFEHNAAYLHAEVANLKNQLSDNELEIRRLKAALAAKNKLLAAKEEEINNLAVKQEFVLNSMAKEQKLVKPSTQPQNGRSGKVSSIRSLPAGNLTAISDQLPDSEAAVKLLAPVQALVIGGTDSWQTKLKAKLPHFTYLAGDDAGFDDALILHADIVFANVRCKFSHGCFYKLIKLVRQQGKQLVFLSKTNIPLTIRQMANAAVKPAPVNNSPEYSEIDWAVEL